MLCFTIFCETIEKANETSDFTNLSSCNLQLLAASPAPSSVPTPGTYSVHSPASVLNPASVGASSPASLNPAEEQIYLEKVQITKGFFQLVQ